MNQLFMNRPGALLDRKLTKAYLSDYMLNKTGQVNLLMMAYDLGIIKEIRTNYPVTPLLRSQLIKRMVQQYSVVEIKAAETVDLWISCLDQSLVDAIDQAEKATKAQKPYIPAVQPKQERHDQTVGEGAKDIGEDFCVNPKLDEKHDRIYIPCGIGNSDFGFTIYGIKKAPMCSNKNSDVFALVYNYLIRSTNVDDGSIPRYISEIESPYAQDYRSIYRTAIILLQMVRHNYCPNNVLELSYYGEQENLQYAVGLINNYAALFCRLIKIPVVGLHVKNNPKAIKVALTKCSGIYCESNSKLYTNAREIWYGRKINYKLTKENLPDLEYILGEISPFDGFKEGQFEALRSMLMAKKHAVCIMPTGSGKSLIYYFASLLQPLPLIIVAPTEILIRDQIRNLAQFHHIDNVAHLKLTSDNCFERFELHNSLNYITPMALQNRHLLVSFRYINVGTRLVKTYPSSGGPYILREEQIAKGPLVSNIVLDEIHCLSNWGHDFRPEYLMLSKFLRKYLDQVDFWGFTATANYTVVEDVQKQLGIPQGNFFSPISFDKYNVSYDFRCAKTEEDMYAILDSIARTVIDRGERTLIFTKSDAISERVADVVGYEADIFSSDNLDAYHHFVDGKCKILIASEELGVGINLPNISCVIHFGLPLSKCEYVQEIGRAGRANESVTSYVIYLENAPRNIPAELLNRNTLIADIPDLLRGVHNDYELIYRKLTNNCPTKDALYEQLISFYVTLPKSNYTVRIFKWSELDSVKQMLYMLYITGYVYDWYTYSQSKDGKGVEILIDISSSEAAIKDTLRRMRTSLVSYFDFLGDNREGVSKANRAKSPEELLHIYVDWYYIKYLYHHNEQFLDLYDFNVAARSQLSKRRNGLLYRSHL